MPTYSFGNSPRAKVQSKEVFPQAPIEGSVNCNVRLGDYMPSPTMTNFLRILESIWGANIIPDWRGGTYWVLGGHGWWTVKGQVQWAQNGHNSTPFVVIYLFTHASSSNYTMVLAPGTHVLVYQLQFQGPLLGFLYLEVPKRPWLIPKTCNTVL